MNDEAYPPLAGSPDVREVNPAALPQVDPTKPAAPATPAGGAQVGETRVWPTEYDV